MVTFITVQGNNQTHFVTDITYDGHCKSTIICSLIVRSIWQNNRMAVLKCGLNEMKYFLYERTIGIIRALLISQNKLAEILPNVIRRFIENISKMD